MPRFPYVKGHWLLGNLREMSKGNLRFMEDFVAKYGKVVQVRIPVLDLFLVTEPKHIRYFLQENNRNYVKSRGYDVLKLFLGQGLLTSEGEFWRKQRRLAQPAFHRGKMEALVGDMQLEIRAIAEEWQNKLDQNGPFQVNISTEMARLAMKIVARALFGTEVQEVIQTVSESITELNEAGIHRILHPFTSPPLWMPTRRNRNFKLHKARMDEVIFSIIRERRKNPSQKEDLLQLLIDARDEDTGEGMSDQKLRDEVMTLFVAGFETTAMGLSWTWWLLHENPEIAEKLAAHGREVLESGAEGTDLLRALTYARKVTDESLRLYPPAWIIGRKPLKPDSLDGHPIPTSCNVLIPTYCVHRDPDLWPDPLKFDPERHTPEKAKKRHKFAYFPFGGGPRLCIGMMFALFEMQLALAMLVPRFRLEPAQEHKPEPEPLITMRPKGGLLMRVFSRN